LRGGQGEPSIDFGNKAILISQFQVERDRRTLALVREMNIEDFANCTNIGECKAALPKETKLEVIARTNRDYIKAAFLERPEPISGGESVDRSLTVGFPSDCLHTPKDNQEDSEWDIETASRR
jgi:hypothetical protein